MAEKSEELQQHTDFTWEQDGNGDKNAKSKRYMKQGAWNFHLPFRCDILEIIKRSHNLAKIGTDLR